MTSVQHIALSLLHKEKAKLTCSLAGHTNFFTCGSGWREKYIIMVTIARFREPVECKECFPGMVVTCIMAC